MHRFARDRISEAIREAEAGTTGHIAVRIVPDTHLDAFERAKHEFEEGCLHAAPGRNATLILVAPIAKRFAVLGDREIHAKVGDAFWTRIVKEMQPHFIRNDLSGGILHAIERIGKELHAHFPVKA